MNIEQFCQRKCNKIKTKTLGELRQALGIIGKPLCVGFLGGDFINFRPKVWDILNFEKKNSLQINIKVNNLYTIGHYHQGPIHTLSS